jgi:hypothetical protein
VEGRETQSKSSDSSLTTGFEKTFPGIVEKADKRRVIVEKNL